MNTKAFLLNFEELLAISTIIRANATRCVSPRSNSTCSGIRNSSSNNTKYRLNKAVVPNDCNIDALNLINPKIIRMKGSLEFLCTAAAIPSGKANSVRFKLWQCNGQCNAWQRDCCCRCRKCQLRRIGAVSRDSCFAQVFGTDPDVGSFYKQLFWIRHIASNLGSKRDVYCDPSGAWPTPGEKLVVQAGAHQLDLPHHRACCQPSAFCCLRHQRASLAHKEAARLTAANDFPNG
mmetsp:Transcript_39443/g.99244  ORF Transcript_39443/g.99244 Transcript_39443/m.99244 type:complete len:234 (+) Transcript_39443:415-1116(+)|eukprot:CAMPEP_0115521130 /NCGR_PEP_ID=MMETSP0271-20121206/79376_1 /TAXON_ID=71861 /ORGANISM="Scrippsiella trochoidea, Strain CCMP3099" /LENGTH=233 /DNA_ID=CAMNT_0002952329 /DNA_START=321 /DNA_END=1022 /DNA_ORIENTATION=+